MKVRHIKIERFRGIKELDWNVGDDFICLLGPGDSTKSTILDAIDLALTPRWNFPFDDADFYNLDTSEPISIAVSVGQVPKELMSDRKFGLYLSGYGNGVMHDEPQDGDEEVLTVGLRVNSSLEPEWLVVNGPHPEGCRISGNDRGRLGVVRLGGYIDRHLSWGRGSVLSRLTGELDDMAAILTEASRTVRQNLSAEKLSRLNASAKEIEGYATDFGVVPRYELRPSLDMRAVNIGESGFALHDGSVPIRRAGLGARRLLIMAMQCQVAGSGGIVLVDEFEHGLEPHRIRHLLHILKERAKKDQFGQVILTTHSPIVAEELPGNLHIVRTNGATTTVRPAPSNLVSTIRSAPESLLGHKVIVCEGKTEVGICRALNSHWINEGSESFACRGVVPVLGGGTSTVKVSLDIADLGYQVAILGDSDTTDISSHSDELEQKGIRVLTWAGGVATEQRVAQDLPWAGLQEVLYMAVEDKGKEAVVDSIADRLSMKPGDIGPIESWQDTPKFRQAIGKAAGDKQWFKRIDLGENLGRIVAKHLPSIAGTDLAKNLSSLKAWIEA